MVSCSVDSGVCATKTEWFGMGDGLCYSASEGRTVDGDGSNPYMTNCNKESTESNMKSFEGSVTVKCSTV